MGAKTIFEQSFIDAIDKIDLFEPFRLEIKRAQEYLLWKKDSASSQLAAQTLNNLEELLADLDKDPAKSQKLKNAIIIGRFDKSEFKFNETLILGEDGGLYLLLNNFNDLSESVISEAVSKDFLRDKIKSSSEKGADWPK